MSKLHITQADEKIKIFRHGQTAPIVTQHVTRDHRPFLHPIVAPDGIGELTEYSPGHHPHQTGLYWGFTRINGTGASAETLKEWFYKKDKPEDVIKQIGRDFFHHPHGEYWQRVSATVLKSEGATVEWQTVYNMLDEDGGTIMRETQTWSAQEQDGRFLIDLNWQADAENDVVVNAFDYGGLFLRMPFRKEIGGRALNGDGAENQDADGQRTRWVGVEMPIPGRTQSAEPVCSIAILDHPANPDHPLPWRVDGQLGVGPCRAILGDWRLAGNSSVNFQHRLLVGCGKLDPSFTDQVWEQFAAS